MKNTKKKSPFSDLTWTQLNELRNDEEDDDDHPLCESNEYVRVCVKETTKNVNKSMPSLSSVHPYKFHI